MGDRQGDADQPEERARNGIRGPDAHSRGVRQIGTRKPEVRQVPAQMVDDHAEQGQTRAQHRSRRCRPGRRSATGSFACSAERLKFRGESFCVQKAALRSENFANEAKILRAAYCKLLKSLRGEIFDFAVSNDFNGLRAILFRAFLSRPVQPGKSATRSICARRPTPQIARGRLRMTPLAASNAKREYFPVLGIFKGLQGGKFPLPFKAGSDGASPRPRRRRQTALRRRRPQLSLAVTSSLGVRHESLVIKPAPTEPFFKVAQIFFFPN